MLWGSLVSPVYFLCIFNTVTWIHLKVILGTPEPETGGKEAERMEKLMRVRSASGLEQAGKCREAACKPGQMLLWRGLEAVWVLSACMFLTCVSSSGDFAFLSEAPGRKTNSLTSAYPSPLQCVSVLSLNKEVLALFKGCPGARDL